MDPRFDLTVGKYEFVWGLPNAQGGVQLALAILADCLKNNPLAIYLRYAYRDKVIATLPRNRWVLYDYEILKTVDTLLQARKYGGNAGFNIDERTKLGRLHGSTGPNDPASPFSCVRDIQF